MIQNTYLHFVNLFNFCPIDSTHNTKCQISGKALMRK